MPSLTLATFNCENLFARYNFDKNYDPVGKDGFTINDLAFDLQDEAEKRITAQAILDVDADVIALQEVESLNVLDTFQSRYLAKMKNASLDIWAWGYYEFGVVAMADDKQSAKVYVGASCGPLCGHGFYYTLQRSPSGKWWITDAEHLWQS